MIPESKVFNFDSATDSALTVLDNNGIKIMLSVGEGTPGVFVPYQHTIDQIIDATLGKYGHHSCVLGFVVEIEFRGPDILYYIPVTDAEAQRWESKVKGHKSNFRLILKHWDTYVMPPTHRGDIIFLDDSNGFSGLSGMVAEFKAWGNSFPQNDVAFQVGYSHTGADSDWNRWIQYLSNPPYDIATAIFQNVPNATSVYWVNLTVDKVFPLA